jgi:5-methyltetrahydropteroyltriglutamate--homocysteine methyltransferase
MLRSADRFLTTHTGSLPRPDDLVRTMFAKEEGVPFDADSLGERIRDATDWAVRRQAEAGVDIVNDGEMSKPSYATYVKDRLSGFGGTGNTFEFKDLVQFPKSAERVFGDPGRAVRKTPACNGPIGVKDRHSPRTDIENLTAAAASVKVAGLFSSAASPGVISLFFRNDHYKTSEEYLFAIAEAMRFEYETIAKAGVTLQLDCPDLAMGRHVQYSTLSLAEFRGRMRLHIEALNHAVRNIPAEQLRMHMCWARMEDVRNHQAAGRESSCSGCHRMSVELY